MNWLQHEHVATRTCLPPCYFTFSCTNCHEAGNWRHNFRSIECTVLLLSCLIYKWLSSTVQGEHFHGLHFWMFHTLSGQQVWAAKPSCWNTKCDQKQHIIVWMEANNKIIHSHTITDADFKLCVVNNLKGPLALWPGWSQNIYQNQTGRQCLCVTMWISDREIKHVSVTLDSPM